MILPSHLCLYRSYDLTTLTPASEGAEEKKKKGNKVDGPKTGPHGGGTVIFKYRLRSGIEIERGLKPRARTLYLCLFSMLIRPLQPNSVLFIREFRFSRRENRIFVVI